MQVPGFLHGRYREVKAATRCKITQLQRGASWDELAGELVDTRELPGLLVLDGPNRLLGGEPHFHFFAPARLLFDAIDDRLPGDTYETLFESVAATRWGFLTLLGQWGQSFLWQPGHLEHFLHAALHWWDELDAEGRRYTSGSRSPRTLWELPTNIQFALARLDVPDHRIDPPLPEGGLAELVALTRAGLPPSRGQMH